MDKYVITRLTQNKFGETVNLVLKANLDTRSEIEHHLKHLDAHLIAVDSEKVVGVIGWYQDNVHYADEAMDDKFPGEEAYWVGFFAVDESYQKRGIGSGLLQKLYDLLRDN